MKNAAHFDLKKIQEALSDAAKLGSQELLRGFDLAKQNVKRFHLIQRRKDLLADLGRTAFEAYKSGASQWPLGEQSLEALRQSDFSEILKEIDALDELLEATRKEK